ncbi:MAG: DUF1207 domain-containing protein [Gammaproteobacteria bacterium]|nr:DUF1207 domain-containing protein [Gammaproteobacteria bacterium]NIR96936.1 DUF1207 domain-containing protein [Gammaproteobacteria bacterium]NIT62638.1 DUF1207 domain-containing protein [Gammaproteobacteria bacterium]NIV19598.1 DUF1207 domain-containing protein [Gammaproteobacteria bacterium]NIX10818.1 DUF1207 domain-containing protein [Gammaproteobacteria bacterium]
MGRFNRRCIAAVCALALLAAPARGGVDPSVSRQDAFLAGALTAVLERELGWARDSYRLEVKEGLATITLLVEPQKRREQLQTALPELQGVNIVTDNHREEEAQPETRRRLYSFLGLTAGTVPFPSGDLFRPLLADPKQPQFFVSLRRYDTPVESVSTAAVGYGETFGFYRQAGERPEDGLQVGISGGLFAQFNLDAESNDLVNADYVVGVPVTYRQGPFSARLRIYHQSSHLGDEFLLRSRPERINLSYESLELLVACQWRELRGYLGGEYLLFREPGDLDRQGLHGGVEYRGRQGLLWGGRPVGGVDVKSWAEHDWDVDTSVKIGLEFGAAEPGRRRLRVMAEGYDGFAPHGQFYNDEISYFGLGVYLGF